MKLYKGNRIDDAFEMEPAEIARRFWQSPQAMALQREDLQVTLELQLRRFMTDPQGLNASWDRKDEKSFEQVWQAARDTWPPSPARDPSSRITESEKARLDMFLEAERRVQKAWGGTDALDRLGPRLYRALVIEEIMGSLVRARKLVPAEPIGKAVLAAWDFAQRASGDPGDDH